MSIFSDEPSNVEVSAVFPDDNPLGLIVNGEQNKLILKFVNPGTGNFTIVNAAASYHNVDKNWATVRNTTALKYNVPLPAGANFSVPFHVFSEFKPSDVGLTVWANIKDIQQDTHRIVAFNQTVSVVEPQGSWFDIQLLFMYIIVGAALAGLSLLGYNTLKAKYFPEQKRRSGSGKRSGATSASGAKKVVVPAEGGKPYPESVKPYEEEWIPSHHLQQGKAAVRRRKGVDGGASSGGEGMTSGGESGSEKKKGGKKGKKN